MLTVPAIWSNRAKIATIQCARNAFGKDSDIEIIGEPQAAGIFALNRKREENYLVEKGHYVVCDAGGGVVDLITYQVKSSEPLELEVSGRGTGSVCGSLFLNRGFENYLKDKLGKYLRDPDVKMQKAWNKVCLLSTL